MMKCIPKLICGILLALLFNFNCNPVHAVTHQMEWPYILKALQLMAGDWYDDSGIKVITVNDKYINSCEVLSAYDFAGSSSYGAGIFHIQERTGIREMRIEWHVNGSPADYITIDDAQMLHRTLPYYHESIGGFHLGMSTGAVEAKFGPPTRILTQNKPMRIGKDVYRTGWYYKDKGIIITFNSKSIDRITLLKQSRLHLSKSGLNCSNPPEAFAKAYAMTRTPPWPSSDFNGVYAIGHGEYIVFGKDMNNIMLTVYDN